MKGTPTIVTYAGMQWPRARLAEALGVPLQRIAKWDRAGLLTPARVELYRHRKRLRQLAQSFGITPTQVSVRVCRGMDRYTASTKPVRLHRKRRGPKVTKSNLAKRSPRKRFGASYSLVEYQLLEKALRDARASSTGADKVHYSRMLNRASEQLVKHEAAQLQIGSAQAQEVQAAE